MAVIQVGRGAGARRCVSMSHEGACRTPRRAVAGALPTTRPTRLLSLQVLPLVGLYLFSAVATLLLRDLVPPGGIALAVKAACWLIPAALYARQRPITAFALGAPAPSGLRRAALLGAAYLAAILLLALAAGGGASPLTWPPVTALVLLIANVIVEEAAFRGFLLLRAARLLRFWKANAVVALGFAAVHVPSFLARQMNPVEVALSCAVLFVFSLVLGEMTRATRSIWPAVVLHSLNNLLG